MSNKTFSKHYYLIVDTETTGAGNVADFGAVVVNRKGDVLASLGVLISDTFENEKMHWSLGNPKRMANGLSLRFLTSTDGFTRCNAHTIQC